MTNQVIDKSYNTTAYNAFANATAIEIRLDVTQIIEKIEAFLSSKQTVYLKDEEGNVFTETREIGNPKANPQGIHAILNFIESIINSAVVQGNFTLPQYEQYVEEKNIDIAVDIIDNCYNWEISEDDINPIINFIMNLICPFISRLIDNKERDSYTQTIRSMETNTVNQNGAKTWNPF